MADMREINIDFTGTGKKLCDACDPLTEHVIRVSKGFAQCNVGGRNLQQLIVRNCDERIAVLSQLGQAGACIGDALAGFKRKRGADNSDGDCTLFTGNFCRYTDGTGSGAAAHTCGQENNIRTAQCLAQHVF